MPRFAICAKVTKKLSAQANSMPRTSVTYDENVHVLLHRHFITLLLIVIEHCPDGKCPGMSLLVCEHVTFVPFSR